MKTTRNFTVAAVLAALPFFACAAMPGFGVVGSGKVVSSERSVGAFDQVASGGSAEVRIHKGPATRVVVTTDDNIQEYFRVEVSGGVLSLGYEPGTMIARTSKLVVDVYMPSLEGASVSGSGDMSLVDPFRGDSFSATVSGSGSISGSVRYEKASIRISGSGKVKLDGSADELALIVSGSGKFDCDKLAARTASVTLSGSGDAEFSVSGRLDALISGSGDVRYRGKPAVNAHVSGSGKVRYIGD